MNSHITSIRRQCEWERKKRAFWRYVWYSINFFFAVTGAIYWGSVLVDWLGGR